MAFGVLPWPETTRPVPAAGSLHTVPPTEPALRGHPSPSTTAPAAKNPAKHLLWPSQFASTADTASTAPSSPASNVDTVVAVFSDPAAILATRASSFAIRLSASACLLSEASSLEVSCARACDAREEGREGGTGGQEGCGCGGGGGGSQFSWLGTIWPDTNLTKWGLTRSDTTLRRDDPTISPVLPGT